MPANGLLIEGNDNILNMRRIINTKNYFFGAAAVELIIHFIDTYRAQYEPQVLIGVSNGGCQFTWGDTKNEFYRIIVFDDVAEYTNGSIITICSKDMKTLKKAISYIKSVWYK